jgi:hypothetical protein
MSKFGNSKIGGGLTFTKRNRYKLKDGDNVYRILPAMGEHAESGTWSVYYNVVFGFKTTEGKHRPFQSSFSKDRKTKEVLSECAATNLILGLKAELDLAKKAKDTVKVAQLAKIVGDYPIMGVYSLNNDHYINVVDSQGNIGQLELGHKAKLALNNEIERIRNTEQFDPLAPETGRYFNIRRTGKALDTLVQVTVVKEKISVVINGKNVAVEQDLVHTIDDALGERLLVQGKDNKWIYKEAANLADLFKRPTPEQVALIVSGANIVTGNSTGIDVVFGKNTDSVKDEPVPFEAPAAVVPTALPVQVAEAAAVADAPVVQETKAAVATTLKLTSPAAASKSTAQTVTDMTPDDFMASMGIKL